MNKAVSVIIPCFNHGTYLLEAIESLEKCDESLFEVIVVNDGSTDPQTLETLRDLAVRYTVIDQKNAGLGAARNSGINAANGKYILLLDADNVVYQNYFTVAIRVLDEDTKVAVVYGKRKLFGDGDAVGQVEPGPFDRNKLVVGNYIDACAVIRKKALEDCGLFATDMPVQGHEDWDLWLTMVEKNWGIYFYDEVAYGYRMRPDSMTSEMSMPENFRLTREYIARKHATLIYDVLSEQYRELRQRRSLIPYFVWRIRDHLRK